MTRAEALTEFVIPAIRKTWNEKKCVEILKALDQEPSSDVISRQAAIAVADYADYTGLAIEDVKMVTDEIVKGLKKLPSVISTEKVGRWILVQRGKYVDVNCSECGFSRIKEFAYNYTVEDISEQEFRDFVEKNKMNFCECCGAKMGVEE